MARSILLNIEDAGEVIALIVRPIERAINGCAVVDADAVRTSCFNAFTVGVVVATRVR